jgi:transposase
MQLLRLVERLFLMSYKPHPPAGPVLIGLDPYDVIGPDHLAQLIDRVVDSVEAPPEVSPIGQKAYSPRMVAKILVYAYATGTFSSRRIAQNCVENMAYIYLARYERPCFKTFCSARVSYDEYLRRVWLSVLANASAQGISFAGKVAIDASRFKANASGDLVIKAEDYDAVESHLLQMLEKAKAIDSREEEEGQAVRTHTGVDASRITIRKLVRSVGKELPEGELTLGVKQRIEASVESLKEAKEEQRKHVSLSDPDARMMPQGSRRLIGMGHAIEVGVDSGLLVSGGTTNEASDHSRLKPLVEESRLHDPTPVVEVVADSGYFNAGDIVDLQASGLDVVVPDSTTAYQMRTKTWTDTKDAIVFEAVEGKNALRCPNGHLLYQNGKPKANGRVQYRTDRECTGCPFAERCLKKPDGKRRYLWVRPHAESMKSYLEKFQDSEMQRKYYARGPGVETVFAYLRRIIGFTRWSLRGKEKVSAEGSLLLCAYQLRKLHGLKLKAA